MPHPLGSPYVRDQLSLRTVPVNDRPLRAERAYVLYWMQSTLRLDDNWALRLAILEADRVNKPLIILHSVDSAQPHASARFHTFQLEAARDLAATAEGRGLMYRLALDLGRDDHLEVIARVAAEAALVVTDQYPTDGVPARTAAIAARIDCRVLATDSVGVVPAACFDREEYSARTMRPKHRRLLAEAAEAVEDRAPKRAAPPALLDRLRLTTMDPRRRDVASMVSRCRVDQAVAPGELGGGTLAARALLAAFTAGGLGDYSRRRSNPSDHAGTSRLSPYLRYGMISPLEVLTTVRGSAPANECEAFLDEMLTWRELALNFCSRNQGFASLASLPAWAQRSMASHAQDAREVTFSLDELERGQTHDDVWNAGQRQLVDTGTMHPVVRMLWGKAVVEWAPTYDAAFAWLVHLNDKYSLDGRDPGSYAGIQWCFGKFDRPFTTRAIWGSIRPMSLKRARAKYDIGDYLARWKQPQAAQVA